MNRNSTLIPTAIVFFGFEVVWCSLGSQNNKITETWSASVKNSLRHHQWLVSKKGRQHKKELKMVCINHKRFKFRGSGINFIPTWLNYGNDYELKKFKTDHLGIHADPVRD